MRKQLSIKPVPGWGHGQEGVGDVVAVEVAVVGCGRRRARFAFVGAVVSTDGARSRVWLRARTMALSRTWSGAQIEQYA
jgi:hypothetical protein